MFSAVAASPRRYFAGDAAVYLRRVLIIEMVWFKAASNSLTARTDKIFLNAQSYDLQNKTTQV